METVEYWKQQIKDITVLRKRKLPSGELASEIEVYIYQNCYLVYITDDNFFEGEFQGDVNLMELCKEEPYLVEALIYILKHFGLLFTI